MSCICQGRSYWFVPRHDLLQRSVIFLEVGDRWLNVLDLTLLVVPHRITAESTDEDNVVPDNTYEDDATSIAAPRAPRVLHEHQKQQRDKFCCQPIMPCEKGKSKRCTNHWHGHFLYMFLNFIAWIILFDYLVISIIFLLFYWT